MLRDPKWGGVPVACMLEEGQSWVWVYNSNMPIKNINPGQKINPEKPQQPRELRMMVRLRWKGRTVLGH